MIGERHQQLKWLDEQFPIAKEKFKPYLDISEEGVDMIFSAQSLGVRRLSLVLGLLAAGYRLATISEPYGPPAQSPGHPWQNLLINLGNYALEGAVYFIAAWATVRIVAWIIAGFVAGRSKISSKQGGG